MGNTKIIACADTVFGIWQLCQDPTIFTVKVKPRRLPLDIPNRFAVHLVEDPEKTWASLVYEEDIPALPSENASLIARFFILHVGSTFTVKQINQQSGEVLSIKDLREALHELEKNGVLKLWREQHNLYHYGLSPEFYTMNTVYAQEVRK